MKKIIILFLLITFCSGSEIDESKLASDSEMVWCLSQENYVRAGSTLIATGWNALKFTESGESYEGDEATKAKEIYRTLENSIIFYKFKKSDTEVFVDYKSFNLWGISNVYKSKTNYLDALKSRKVEGDSYKSYQNNIFNHWRKIKTSFELEDSDKIPNVKENYINSYSICKLWYESNN